MRDLSRTMCSRKISLSLCKKEAMVQSNLSPSEEATNFRTMRHIERVRNLLNVLVSDLLKRGELHDQSKLEHPEVSEFAKAVPLSGLTLGSPEYEASKKSLEVALKHHYGRNRHHPEHWKNGIRDMNLCDLMEMFADWKASSELQHDGNVRKSIETQGQKYGLPPVLIEIFENTVELLETP